MRVSSFVLFCCDNCKKVTDLWVKTTKIFLDSATETISRTEVYVLRGEEWSGSINKEEYGQILT